jgi:predicted dehydrogenase
MNDSALSRRDFLGTTGAAAAGIALGQLAAPAGARADAAAERLSVGIVGPGGRGQGLLRTFFDVCKDSGAELTAVCDLWARNRERGADLVKQASSKAPRTFRRLEDMLAANGLDAVVIATPDHAHAQHLVQCLRAGKHVYCEKPFANVAEEANAALDAYRKSDKVVTIGTQRRSDPRYLAAADLMRSGVLGPVVQVDMIQNAYSPYRWRRDEEVKALKETDVDWKAFLMGRAERKFDARQYLEFRLFHDFSTGIIDQWMTHMIDTVHLLTGAKFPRSVVAHGGTYAWKDHRENGDTVHVLLEYPEGFLCTYACTLANGFGSGCRILGRQGTLEYEDNWRLSGEGVKDSKLAAAKPIAPKEGLQGDMDHIHMRNWLECVRQGKRETNCTPEHGYQHALACIMADRALHTGRRMVFDETSRTIQVG